jgi:hypothetical protein
VILNFTQHKATPEQVEAGVVDLNEGLRERLCDLLTFEDIPSSEELESRVDSLVQLALDVIESKAREGITCLSVMLGGAPFLMPPLQKALAWKSVGVVYAFSKRESVETVMDDGSVRKTNVFRHAGFVRAH